jgi:hypothetical protein
VLFTNFKHLHIGGFSMTKLPARIALASGLALALSVAMIAYAAETPSGAPNTVVPPDVDASKSPGAKEPTARKGTTRAERMDSGNASSMTRTPADTNARQVPDTDVTKSPGAKEPAGGSRY